MASNGTTSIEGTITCGICQKLFDDPCILPCSHTFCRKCIKEKVSVDTDQFKCFSHDGFTIPNSEIDSLPFNQAAHNLVKLYSSIQRSNHCSNCHSVVAEYWCNKCEVEYCSECSRTIHEFAALQNHKLISIDQKPSEMILCGIHSTKQLEFWCHTCNKLVCNCCILLEHKSHEYDFVDNFVKVLKPTIENDFDGIQSSLDYRMNRVETLITEIDNESESSKERFIEVMEFLRRVINEHEKNVLENVWKSDTNRKKQFEEYKTLLKNVLQNFNFQRATLKLLVSMKDNTKLLQTKQEFDDYVTSIHETLHVLQMPIRTDHHLDGPNLSQELKEKILQYGQYVEVPPYCNSELEKRIADNRTNKELVLYLLRLTDQDMRIVADALRTSTTLTTLRLQYNQIGDHGAQYLADALKQNKTLTILYLFDNQIGNQGAQYLADALKQNKVLTELDLSNNQMGDQGAQYLADALKQNKTLTELDLRANQIGDQGAQYLADALKQNKALTELNLGGNEIDHQGARYLADALKQNETLTALDLFNNQIGDQGAQYLADALRQNKTLTAFDLKGSQIGDQGVKYLADVLKQNKTLTELDLRTNQIGDEGARYLADALKQNKTLTELNLGSNKIDQQGAEYLADVLQQKNQTLTSLYLFNNQIGKETRHHVIEILKVNTRLHIFW